MAKRPSPLAVPQGKERARLAPWSPTASREEARTYLQQRLALLSKLWFFIFWVLVVGVWALYELYPEKRPADAAIIHGFAYAALAGLTIIWYTLGRRSYSIAALYRIDAVYGLFVGVAFGISLYLNYNQRAGVYAAFIWEIFAVFSRVLIVPSTPSRSAIVSTLSLMPLVLAGVLQSIHYPEFVELPPVAMIMGTAVTSAVAVVLATTGSRVIFGLRRQATAATQLGQYTLHEKIGEGGMGAVYKAHHAMLRRPTAVKLLPLERYDERSVRRFEHEVQHTSRLTHPNTVAIFDYGNSPDGLFYYAMEYIDGIDLQRLVGRFGPQPAPRVVHILRQVCGALDEAHLSGLIHRDIKPANILLCRRGREPDFVKVVDFGLVTEVTHGASDRDLKVIAGTPAYLAPEAVTSPREVSGQSDLYSLGAVGYFLLTGEPVFEGSDAVEVCVQHVTTPPVPPSQRTKQPIPADLEAVILCCLHKDPSERYEGALALRQALRQVAACDEWDESAAIAWWDAFEAEPKGKPSSVESLPSTMTIDLDERPDWREIADRLGRSPKH
jgi:serine/threonine-protein kinase